METTQEVKQFQYPKALHHRGAGNTTRQADFIIQELFNNLGEYIPVIDHWQLDVSEGNLQSSERLLHIIINRLDRELYIKMNKIEFHLKSNLRGMDERYRKLSKELEDKEIQSIYIIKIKL